MRAPEIIAMFILLTIAFVAHKIGKRRYDKPKRDVKPHNDMTGWGIDGSYRNNAKDWMEY